MISMIEDVERDAHALLFGGQWSLGETGTTKHRFL